MTSFILLGLTLALLATVVCGLELSFRLFLLLADSAPRAFKRVTAGWGLPARRKEVRRAPGHVRGSVAPRAATWRQMA